MSEINDEYENIRRLRDELSEIDPAIAEFDLEDPDARLALVLAHAVFKGEEITIECEDDDGRVEVMTLESAGSFDDGRPKFALSIGSSDSLLSEDTAGMVANLMQEDLDKEIDNLLD